MGAWWGSAILSYLCAHHRAAASRLARFVYRVGAADGHPVFGDVDPWTLVGCCVIVAEPVYAFYREAVLGRPEPRSLPLSACARAGIGRPLAGIDDFDLREPGGADGWRLSVRLLSWPSKITSSNAPPTPGRRALSRIQMQDAERRHQPPAQTAGADFLVRGVAIEVDCAAYDRSGHALGRALRIAGARSTRSAAAVLLSFNTESGHDTRSRARARGGSHNVVECRRCQCAPPRRCGEAQAIEFQLVVRAMARPGGGGGRSLAMVPRPSCSR